MKQKIKRKAAGILAAAMMLSVGTISTLAAGPVCERNFTDTDKDGICDYVENNCQYRNSEKNHIGNHCGRNRHQESGHGRHFADANGDGICDNYGTRQGRAFCGRP